jgi:Ca2+-binding EF-hand superfamily protein
VAVAKKSEWAELIAFATSRAYHIFQQRFEDYLHASLELDQGGMAAMARQTLEEYQDKCNALYGLLWTRYDESGRGYLTKSEFQRLCLDLLMEQRKHLPQLLEMLVRDLLVMTRQALEKVKRDSGVQEDFVEALMRDVEEAKRADVAEMTEQMDEMVRDYLNIAEKLWIELDPRSEHLSREHFLERFPRVALGLAAPDQLVERLSGVVSSKQRRVRQWHDQPGGESATLFETVVAEVAAKESVWAPVIASSLQQVHEILKRQFSDMKMEPAHTGGDVAGAAVAAAAAAAPAAGGGAFDDISLRVAQQFSEFERRNAEFYDRVFAKYDVDGDGVLNKADCKRLVLELLIEERQYLPKLLDSLIVELIDLVKEDASKPPPDFPVAIPAGFANMWYVDVVADTAAQAVQALMRSLDEMIKDYANLSQVIWTRLDRNHDGLITKAQFVKHFPKIAVPIELIDPQSLADHLQGV